MDKENTKNKANILNFLLYFLMISSVTFAFLYLFGLVPESLKGGSVIKKSSEVSSEVNIILPTRIVIEKIGVDAPVYNPENKQLSFLNKLIDQGAVRYPDSGTIGKGNILIFGHSADFYTIVNNPAYKTFNGINKLSVGDRIVLYSGEKKYYYIVQKKTLDRASDIEIEFGGNSKLTISTCNTLGEKEDRQVIEAYPVAI